jgi:hypothetical protein
MKNKPHNNYYKIIFLSLFTLVQASLFAQVKKPAHAVTPIKKTSTVVVKVIEQPKPTDGCVSGNCVNGFGKKINLQRKEVYEGNWKDGKKEGQGTFTSYYETYTGNWHDDMEDGQGEIKQLLEHDGKMTISRIYTGAFERLDYKGQGKCTMYTDWGTKIMFVMEGNFERQQLLGKGSLIIPREGTYYSDNFTDNFNFTTGQFVKENTTQRVDGSLKSGFFTASNTTASSSNTASPAQSTSMLDYGIFAKQKKLPANYGSENSKTYLFKTNCSSGGKSFNVISRISADLSKHSFDDVRNEAIRVINRNSWYPNGSTDYLGIQEDVKLIGTPGRDYVVSDGSF